MSRIPAAYTVDLGYPLYLVMRMRLVCHEYTPRIAIIDLSKGVPVLQQARQGTLHSRFHEKFPGTVRLNNELN